MASRVLIATMLALLASAAAAGEKEDATQTAREFVAKHFGEDLASIPVEDVQSVRWPDASLGCGPAASGASEPVRGYRVMLKAAGRMHAVHVAGSDARLCTTRFQTTAGVSEESSAMNEKPQPEPDDPGSKALVAKARADLQRRLSVKAEEIQLLEFKAMVWPDSSLGCPRPGMNYTQVQRDGFLIRFSAQGRNFNYHGGSGRDPFLCDRPAG
jgi:hypothetical protein